MGGQRATVLTRRRSRKTSRRQGAKRGMTTATDRSHVAFVLSGGASLGAIQVGMLRALVDRGIVPDTIVATSVGAVNGAFVASRGATPETVEELATLWRGVRRGNVFPPEPFNAEELMSQAEADTRAFLSGRAGTVVPLRRTRRRRHARPGVQAELPPAG